MDNGGDILRLCRLCLVKDDVNIPIFEEQGDIRQIFLKISSCLPVKVSREDKLPKKICDGCSYKLDMLYEFWNTTANAEKQLLSWLGEAGMNAKMADGTISAVAQQIKPVETFVKQEAIDPSDIHADDNDDDKSYMFQQKFAVEEAGPSATVTSNEEEPPPKRARRTAAVKAQIAMDPESDDDDDSGEPITKVEDESDESEGDDHEPPFVDVPSTSADDQPGPSGVGKDGVEAPLSATVNLDAFLVTLDNGKEKFKCPTCLKTFSTKQYFKSHLLNHTSFKPYECIQCGKSFVKKKQLTAHILDEHDDINIFQLPTEMVIEKFSIVVENGKEVYKCATCFKTFSSKHYFKSHLLSHTDFKPFRCMDCGKTFKRKQELTSHSLVHNANRKIFQCEVCKKIMTTKSGLILHQRRHLKLYNVFCDYCKKGFYSKTTLTLHVNSKHTGKSTFICEICGRPCYDKTSLDNHRAKHDISYGKKKNIKCELCETKFIDKKYLLVHMYKLHGSGNRFVCDICGKKLCSKVSLQEHMIAVHEGLKPHKCKMCDQSFANKTTLRLHERRHTGVRPYKCSHCERAFTQSHSLKMHLRLHTGEKPEVCTLCNSNFVSKNMLRSHLKSKHKVYDLPM